MDVDKDEKLGEIDDQDDFSEEDLLALANDDSLELPDIEDTNAASMAQAVAAMDNNPDNQWPQDVKLCQKLLAEYNKRKANYTKADRKARAGAEAFQQHKIDLGDLKQLVTAKNKAKQLVQATQTKRRSNHCV